MEEAELRACIAGLYIGISLHNPIILETDCTFVVASLASGDYDRSATRDLKMKALSMFASPKCMILLMSPHYDQPY